MIETEYHQIEYEMISCEVSEKAYRSFLIYFSPRGQIFSPAIFPFYFYLQKSQKYSENEDIESKHDGNYEWKYIFFKENDYLFCFFIF